MRIFKNREQLRKQTNRICKPENITSEYMRGLANGVRQSLAIMDGEDIGTLILYGQKEGKCK